LYLERLTDTWNVDSAQFEHRLYTWSHWTASGDRLPRRYHFAILSSIHNVEFVYTESITRRIPAPSQPNCASMQLPVDGLYTALCSQVGNTFVSTVQIPTRRPNILNQVFVFLQPLHGSSGELRSTSNSSTTTSLLPYFPLLPSYRACR